jgi:hypothetical protein
MNKRGSFGGDVTYTGAVRPVATVSKPSVMPSGFDAYAIDADAVAFDATVTACVPGDATYVVPLLVTFAAATV